VAPEDKDYKVTDRRGFAADGSERESNAPEPEQTAPEPAPAGELPDVDFNTLVLSMATSAVALLEGLDDQGEKTQAPNLPLARQSIDIIAMLQKKTKGNLTGEEERLLDHILYDLRLQYVAAQKR
jgi:hypothetical protein